MPSTSLLVTTLALALLLTTACEPAAPSSTPTSTSGAAASPQTTPTGAQPATSAPTTLPAMDPAALSGWKIYVRVIYGCECAGPPAAGIIDVIAIPPSQVEAANLTPITVEIDHESMIRPVEVPLEFSDRLIDSCGLNYSGTLRGFAGAYVVLAEEDLPRLQPNTVVLPATPLLVRLIVMDDVQQRFRVEVTPSAICAAIS
jgi:hypothetical protein